METYPRSYDQPRYFETMPASFSAEVDTEYRRNAMRTLLQGSLARQAVGSTAISAEIEQPAAATGTFDRLAVGTVDAFAGTIDILTHDGQPTFSAASIALRSTVELPRSAYVQAA